jgi:hypothetical protein
VGEVKVHRNQEPQAAASQGNPRKATCDDNLLQSPFCHLVETFPSAVKS